MLTKAGDAREICQANQRVRIFGKDTLENFMQRRFERCRMVVENSATLGGYEFEGVAIETLKKLQEVSW